jgi:hypothetical protein
MSTYVYIALEGLRTSPISESAWLAAVQQCDELVVERTSAPFTSSGQHVVRLKKNRRATLRLDRFGIAGARDPSEELVAAMFKVASLLGANVYSDRFNMYKSSSELMHRRTQQRRIFDKQRAYKERQQLVQIGLWCALGLASALFGLLLGTMYLAVRALAA